MVRHVAIALALVAAWSASRGASPTKPITVHVSLSEPEGLAFDVHGHLYVADTGHNRILELTAAGKVLHTWGKHGKKPGQFDAPEGVATDAQGSLYVADYNNRRLQKLSPAGKPVAQWNEGDPKFGCECRDVAVDARGSVYVADESTVYLYHLSSALKHATKWNTGDSSLLAVRLDVHGNVWLTTAGDQVKEYSATGKSLVRWGRQGEGRGQFDEPDGLALDRQGNVYVADAANNRVQKLSAAGRLLAIFAGAGQSNNPGGVAVDSAGRVYIADTYNDRIEVFSPAGVLLAVWGSA